MLVSYQVQAWEGVAVAVAERKEGPERVRVP